MTTPLTAREFTDHLFLLTLVSAGEKSFGVLDKIMERAKARQLSEGTKEPIYHVEVKVNGIELDFQDFTNKVRQQLDEMVMHEARALFDEHFVNWEIHDTLSRINRELRDLGDSLEAKARVARGLPPKSAND